MDSKDKIYDKDFIYLVVPIEYRLLYQKLLIALSDFGVAMINDCNSGCSAKNKTIIDCWNIFQSAIACKALGQEKTAKVFINYITAQLNLYYSVTGVPQSGEIEVLPDTVEFEPEGGIKVLHVLSEKNWEMNVEDEQENKQI